MVARTKGRPEFLKKCCHATHFTVLLICIIGRHIRRRHEVMSEMSFETTTTFMSSSSRSSLFSLSSIRLRICLLLMFGLFFTVSMRINLGMAMVCMVNTTAFVEPEKHNQFSLNESIVPDGRCSRSYDTDSLATSGYHGTLLWTPGMQSLLFSATFYGGLVTIALSGYLADRFGPKHLLMLAVLDYSIVSLLSPLLANTNFYAFFSSRVVMGLGEGFMIPTIASLSARWFPPAERGAMAAMYTSGNQLAGTLGGVISASLCSVDILGGWPLIFYLFGGLGCVWCILFSILGSNSPDENKWISDDEMSYITTTLPHTPGSTKRKTNAPVPWKEMFTSTVVLSNFIAQFSFNFSATIMQSYLPAYFRDVLLLDLKSNGLYTVLPFLSQLIFKNVFGHLSDYLKRRGLLGQTTSAKLFQSIGSFGTAACFLSLALFVNCERPTIALVILGIHGLCFSSGMSGFYISLLSVAPIYTGVIISLSMLFGMIANSIAPLTFGLVNSQGTEEEWQNVYIICAALNLFAGVFFLIFGSAKIQVWALVQPEKITVSEGTIPLPEKKRNRTVSEMSTNDWTV
uniref:MFS domain-containing protein n=1 Tax=Steinernema glaseri TaxID=37863 RepID=A0A1I7YH42_9BILA